MNNKETKGNKEAQIKLAVYHTLGTYPYYYRDSALVGIKVVIK